MTHECISRDKSTGSQILGLGDPGERGGVGGDGCTSSCTGAGVPGFVCPVPGMGQTGAQGTEQCEPCCRRDPPSSYVHVSISLLAEAHPDASEMSDNCCCHSSCECPVSHLCGHQQINVYWSWHRADSLSGIRAHHIAVGEIRDKAGLG